MEFQLAFEMLLGNEGIISMDPRDRGNWTGGKIGSGVLKGSKYGISAAAYPSLDIENLTKDDAQGIAKRDYWSAAGCDVVPDALRFDLFDMSFNSGVRAAIKALQTACGAESDGVLGSETLMRTQTMATLTLIKRFNGARLMHLTSMPADEWASQGRGLVNRIANNLMRA